MSDSELPSRIGNYDIHRKLGAGGMGTVYLGQHRVSGQLVAVKVLSASLAQESGVKLRFEREIEALGKLSGPHIVALLDSGQDQTTGQLYFAMDLVDGETLTDRLLKEKRLTWEEAVDIALQICAALKSAHAAGVIHRDIKPSNLLIGNDGIVKLTDFGVAQLFATQRLTVTGGIIGTAEYMSPEQAEGRRCTQQSDLYSLGAVLYVMLAGRPPFTGTSSIDIIRKHLTARFDRPSMYAPETPRLLDDIVCQLLEKTPDKRLSDAHIVSLRLKEIVKRVELSQRDETEIRSSESFDLLAPTVVGRTQSPDEIGETRPAVASDRASRGRGARGPGAATMMRNAIVEELQRPEEKSAIARLFDNSAVLVLSLILLIVGGFWWIDHFGPDNATDSENPDLEATSANAEVERFLQLAAAYHRSRDYGRELALLNALHTVLHDDETQGDGMQGDGMQGDESRGELSARLEARIISLQQHLNDSTDGYRLARESFERARQLVTDGDSETAARLLKSLLVLYGSDPEASGLAQQIRDLLNQISQNEPEAALPDTLRQRDDQ